MFIYINELYKLVTKINIIICINLSSDTELLISVCLGSGK